ncbi:MAG: hypothetical protein H0U65_17160 [Rubrobacter sp.]|nr:hypothetical protein [Rubrobacter sp.]
MSGGNKAKVLAGRRVYHVSMGILEAALYGVPISFFGRFLTAQLGVFLTVVLGFVAWGLVAAWVVKRADAKFEKGASGRVPSGDAGRLSQNSQTSVLKYAAVASLALLAFTLVPLFLSSVFPSVGVWVPYTGIGFFSFVILLALTALFSLGGMLSSLRASVYPEYPGFVATLLFALAMIPFFVSYIIAV